MPGEAVFRSAHTTSGRGRPPASRPGSPAWNASTAAFALLTLSTSCAPCARFGFAPGADDGLARGYRGVVAADPHVRRGQVARDGRTGLPQAEQRDDQRLPALGHHTRGWSAVTRVFSAGSAGNPDPAAAGSGMPAVARFGLAAGIMRRRHGRLLEVIADELALLGQQLIEVLVDVGLADGLRGQVQVLDLLELAGLGVNRVRPSVPGPAAASGRWRHPRRAASPVSGAGRRAVPGGSADDTSGSNGPLVSSGTMRSLLGRAGPRPGRTSRTGRPGQAVGRRQRAGPRCRGRRTRRRAPPPACRAGLW